jgi:hypothetical protein
VVTATAAAWVTWAAWADIKIVAAALCAESRATGSTLQEITNAAGRNSGRVFCFEIVSKECLTHDKDALQWFRYE